MAEKPTLNIRGFKVYKSILDRSEQAELVGALRDVVQKAPLFSPMTPYGKPMSVRMTSAGSFGWFSDRSGYRYARAHPNGSPWPDIPHQILEIWDRLTQSVRKPECCLINFYDETAKMGMHQDKDEADFAHPVVSISLGDDALFRIGTTDKRGKTESVWLNSGDVVVMGDEARLSYHGIDRVKHNSSTLLPHGGRINVTLRVVT